MSADEILGLIKGLGEVFKDHQTPWKDTASNTQQQIHEHSTTVQTLCKALRSKETISATSLRLPQLSLPEFTGREHLDRFAEHLTHVLLSSGVSPKFWVTYLKQQCQKDAHAFEYICFIESSHALRLSKKTTKEEFISYFDRCLANLTAHRCVPKEQQIC